MPSAAIEDYFTAAEVARQLKCSERAVIGLLARRELIGFRVGKLWRVKASEIAAFVERSSATDGGTNGCD